jgi:hypothetical protein
MWTVICDKCNAKTEMDMEAVRALEADPDGFLKCPKCGEFGARVQRDKGGGALTTEGG